VSATDDGSSHFSRIRVARAARNVEPYGIARCLKCGAVLRPGVVLFGSRPT
jgi:NAD-dependent SIR2 family protein deacetylase